MNKRRLILAGGTVAFAAIRVAKRNRRPPRGAREARAFPAAVALPVYVTTIAGPWFAWDAGGFAGQIWGFFGIVWDQVKAAVMTVVNAAAEILTGMINAVDDAVKWLETRALAGIGAVSELAHKGLDAVAGVIVDTYDMLDATFNIVRQQIKDLFEGFWHDFKDIMGDLLPDFIGDIFGDLWDTLKALAGIGMDGVSFLLNLIDDPISFLWNLLSDVVGDAIDAALGGLGDLIDALLKIWHIIVWLGEHAAELTTDVLEKLWDILWWFVTHIDDFTIDAFDDLLNMTPDRFAEKMIEAMDANRSGIEEKFAGWLG